MVRHYSDKVTCVGSIPTGPTTMETNHIILLIVLGLLLVIAGVGNHFSKKMARKARIEEAMRHAGKTPYTDEQFRELLEKWEK